MTNPSTNMGYIMTRIHKMASVADVENGLEDMGRGKGKLGRS